MTSAVVLEDKVHHNYDKECFSPSRQEPGFTLTMQYVVPTSSLFNRFYNLLTLLGS